MRVGIAIALALLLGETSRANAQSVWSDLSVPTAAFKILDIPSDRGRALLMSRAIRILHSIPRQDPVSAQMAELERLLLDLDLVVERIERTGDRGVSLAMTKSSTERGALKDVLGALGLHLREQKGAYLVEVESSREAAALRKRLLLAGVDCDAALTRLNGGETVVIAPEVAMLPLPLGPEAWTNVIFEQKLSAPSLFSAIIRDRQASLLYHGVQAMTPTTRAYLIKNSDLLRHFYKDVAGPVAAFGGSFEVEHDGRLVVPGGPDAVELWEALVGEQVTRPDRFGRALFDKDSGRLAYFLSTLAQLDEPRRRFALGLWLTDPGIRLERFRVLYRTFVGVDSEWSLHDTPFARPANDPATLLAVVAVSPQGSPVLPASTKLWTRAFERTDLPGPDARDMRDQAEDVVVDAAWLAEQLNGLLPPQRRARMTQLAFGQRVFAAARPDEMQDVLVGLRGFARFPAAMLALERLGMTDPGLYAKVARRALVVDGLEDESKWVPMLTQFQGALALLERLARTGAVPPEMLHRLVTSLVTVPITQGSFKGGIAQWIESQLLPSLPADDSLQEDQLLGALADRALVRTFEWEGESYRADPRAALQEMQAVRLKQGGNSLDVVLTVFRHAESLMQGLQTLDELKAITTALRADAARLASARSWPDAPGNAPEVKNVVDRAVKDLDKITKPKDLPRAQKIADPLVEVLDYLIGETLVALAYAPLLGSPSGILGSGADVWHRHTFGVGRTGSREANRRSSWLKPHIGSAAIEGEAFTGSLLGLDLALARKRLRRLVVDRLPGPPKLNSNDSATFVETLALVNPQILTDAGRDAIGAALARGRSRLTSAADAAAVDVLAWEAQMSDGRRQLLQWAADKEPEHLERLFSVGEIFWLGAGVPDGPHREELNAWGMSQVSVSGCHCLRFPDPGSWDTLAGRETTQQLPASVPDVNLQVAGLLSELKVPAALFPAVLSLAMQEYLDTVPALYSDDWQAIAGHAWQLTRERVEDYVSAVIASGPTRMESAAPSAR
jgi:hypothetical protein